MATAFLCVVPALLLPHAPLSARPPSGGPPRTAPVTASQQQRQRYTPLATPADYAATLAAASNRTVSVVRFAAPWCRTCLAARPKLDAVARRWPDADFYSLELVRNGKRAGDSFHTCPKYHNSTHSYLPKPTLTPHPHSPTHTHRPNIPEAASQNDPISPSGQASA